MDIPPLDHIGFGPRSHKLALRFLAALYCEGNRGFTAGRSLRKLQRARVLLATYLHLVPYSVMLALLGRCAFTEELGLTAWPISSADYAEVVAIGLATGLAMGLAMGIVNLVAGLTFSLGSALAIVLGAGVGGGLAFGLGFGLGFGLAFGIGFPAALPVRLAGSLGLGLGIGLIVALYKGLPEGLAVGLGLTVAFAVGDWTMQARFYYLPLHWLLCLAKSNPTFYKYHPVFWDHASAMPFPGLDLILVLYTQAQPADGRAQIESLITERPPHRAAALRAKTIVLARDAAKVGSLIELDGLLAQLPQGAKGYLAQTTAVVDKALAISRQQQYVDAADRPYFREQAILALRAEVQAFYIQVATYQEPLASEFRRAGEAWLQLVEQQLERVKEQRGREPTPQVFRAGDPVQRDTEAFVARWDILATIENEVMAGSGCPGFLLYGRRRIGKSTVIRNLEGFLPETVMPVVLSMQNPVVFASEASLGRAIAAEITRVHPPARQITSQVTDLRTFYQFLEVCNAMLLETAGRRLLLCVDEFEELDHRIGQGAFSRDLPAVLRESIQNHRRITWLFAGSHHLGELPHVRWSSYFVSLRTIEVTPLTLEQTRLLLTEPLKHSRLERQTHQAAKLFGTYFWGDGGIQRIHDEAAGWPHLVQLIAGTIVDLCNTRGTDRADAGILEDAVTKAVTLGDTTLSELMLYRSDEYPKAWDYLRGFRKQERQRPPEDDALRLTLKRHLLVKEEDGEWVLRVPLMARWLRERT